VSTSPILDIQAGHPNLADVCCPPLLREPISASQAAISHHLKILVDAGIFTRDKRGVWAYSSLVPEAMNALSAVLNTAC